MRHLFLHEIKTFTAAFLFLGAIAASLPAELITAIPGSELLREALGGNAKQIDVTRWGVRFSYTLENMQTGIALIGVFSSPAEANERLDDRVLHTSVPPSITLAVPVGDRAAGWEGRLVFVRNNVLVELQLPSMDVERDARLIDEAIRKGLWGVRKGSRVDTPIIEDVEYHDFKWTAHVTSRQAGYTAFVDKSGMDTTSDHLAAEIYFATEGCVLSEPIKCTPSFFSAKRQEARIKDKKEKDLLPETQRQHVEDALSTLLDMGASPGLRNKAVVALGLSGDEATVPILLVELGKTSDPVVKQNTIAALGRLRAKQAVPHLLKLLDAPVTGNVSDEEEWDAIIRRQAANALGCIGDSSALATLKKVMDTTLEYQSVRDAAKSAIRKIEKTQAL
jgi:hypothetical protein